MPSRLLLFEIQNEMQKSMLAKKQLHILCVLSRKIHKEITQSSSTDKITEMFMFCFSGGTLNLNFL